MEVTQTIRNLDEETYRKFRGKCAELKINTGGAATEAFKMWLEQRK